MVCSDLSFVILEITDSQIPTKTIKVSKSFLNYVMVILTIAGFFTILGEVAVTMYLQAQLAFRIGFCRSLSSFNRLIAPSSWHLASSRSKTLVEILKIIIIEDRILQRQ